MAKLISQCPGCGNALKISTLQCTCCGMELKGDFELSRFEQLNAEQYELLISFLKNRGNLKEVQADLKLSYPTVKKKLDELLCALHLTDISQKQERKDVDVSMLQIDYASNRPSDIIKSKLKEHGGHVTVYTQRGLPCEIYAEADGRTFTCDKLPVRSPYEYDVFNVIIDLLIEQGGHARKGNGRTNKLGEAGCEENTVVGVIAKQRGYHAGESVYDPVFVMAAVLEWAGLAENGRGELILTEKYKETL